MTDPHPTPAAPPDAVHPLGYATADASDPHNGYERQKFDDKALSTFSVLAYIAAAPFVATVVLGFVALVRAPNAVVIAGMLCSVAMAYALIRIAGRLRALARSKPPTTAQRLPI
jgi:hypothetical protein